MMPPGLIGKAEGAAEILSAIARTVWEADHDGAPCPADMVPSEDGLAEWINKCPGDVLDESVSRAEAAGCCNPQLPGKWRWKVLAEGGKPPRPVLQGDLRGGRITVIEDIESIHAAWLEWKGNGADFRWVSPDGPPKHPLAPIVRAWQASPASAETETRADRRIVPTLPGLRIGESRAERQRGTLFGGLLEGRGENPELPLFDPPPRKSVAILDMADASGVPVMAQGKGAPLEARLFVGAALAVRPADRKLPSVRLALTVRELRDALFPHGWRIGRDWPRMKEALQTAHNYTIRLPDGGLWYLLALRRLPAEDRGGRPGLDEIVVLDVAMPPGMVHGPSVRLPEMNRLSVESAPRWRAYIAAHSLAFLPGTTRLPAGKAGRRANRWGWARNPDAYPVLTAEDRRRLAFGENDKMHRTRGDIDAAWRDLPDTVLIAERAIDPKTGEVGWRVVPSDAAEAIGRGGVKEGGEG